jgi:lysophospholipase L1-like esterase
MFGKVEEAKRTASIVPHPRYDGGANPLRLDSQYAQTMISVAEKSGVNWFDARPILDKDSSVFFDFVHFDEEGHKKIADGLYEYIVKQGLLKLEPSPTKIREPAKIPSEAGV